MNEGASSPVSDIIRLIIYIDRALSLLSFLTLLFKSVGCYISKYKEPYQDIFIYITMCVYDHSLDATCKWR